MSRLVPAAALSLAALLSTGPAPGADFGEPLRGPYGDGCCYDDFGYEDPLEFEAGIRYWYGIGQHAMSIGSDSYEANDASHILEGHFRIDDTSTDSYLRGTLGYAALIHGTYSRPDFSGTRVMQGGSVKYAIFDFGMTPLGGPEASAGAFVGYQFLHDNPDMGRVAFRTASGGGDSTWNDFDIHALRLGVVGRAELGPFDINAQAAIIPYAHLSGTYGAFYQAPFAANGTVWEQGSAGTITGGSLFGASGELLVGYSPLDNVTVRAGVRGYYLAGTPTIYYTVREVGNSGNSQGVYAVADGFSLFRYGPLAELSVSF